MLVAIGRLLNLDDEAKDYVNVVLQNEGMHDKVYVIFVYKNILDNSSTYGLVTKTEGRIVGIEMLLPLVENALPKIGVKRLAKGLNYIDSTTTYVSLRKNAANDIEADNLLIINLVLGQR